MLKQHIICKHENNKTTLSTMLKRTKTSRKLFLQLISFPGEILLSQLPEIIPHKIDPSVENEREIVLVCIYCFVIKHPQSQKVISTACADTVEQFIYQSTSFDINFFNMLCVSEFDSSLIFYDFSSIRMLHYKFTIVTCSKCRSVAVF